MKCSKCSIAFRTCYWNCAEPELNIQTHPMNGHWKLKRSLELNWNFQRGGGFKPKKPSVGGGGMDIFWNHTLSLAIIIRKGCITLSW